MFIELYRVLFYLKDRFQNAESDQNFGGGGGCGGRGGGVSYTIAREKRSRTLFWIWRPSKK
jgi:hypothetical protein